MGCRCSERAGELRSALLALGRGDIARVGSALGFVVRTGAEDAAQATRAAADKVTRTAAAVRLAIRRR